MNSRLTPEFRPSRSRGQCFLRDAHVIDRILEAIAPRPGETLLEIGAGQGQLTFPLLETGARVVAIEADRKLYRPLAERAEREERLDVVAADASKLDYTQLLETRTSGPIRACGNLPYSVASPILLRLLSHGTRFSQLVLMFQKEVAERLTASPGTKDYSFLTVIAQQAAQVRTLFRISPDAFKPRPRVASALVELRLRHEEAAPNGNEKTFRSLVRGLLTHRRKTIANNIKHLPPGSVAPDRIHEGLASLDIDPRRRAETLSVEEFAGLSQICASTR